MRLRHIKGCEEFVNNSEWTITDPKANKGSWQLPQSLKRADRFLVVSESTKNDLSSFFGIEKDRIETTYLAGRSNPVADAFEGNYFLGMVRNQKLSRNQTEQQLSGV